MEEQHNYAQEERMRRKELFEHFARKLDDWAKHHRSSRDDNMFVYLCCVYFVCFCSHAFSLPFCLSACLFVRCSLVFVFVPILSDRAVYLRFVFVSLPLLSCFFQVHSAPFFDVFFHFRCFSVSLFLSVQSLLSFLLQT